MKFLVLLFLVGLAAANVLPQERQEEYLEEEEYIGQEEEDRSLTDIWNKIKEKFHALKIELKEKYMRFGEWVKNSFKEGIEEGGNAIENIKRIAQEFIHAKDVTKEVAQEAEEFFDKHKEDLGDIWNKVKKTAQDFKNGKNSKPHSKPTAAHRRKKTHKRRRG